MSVLPPQGLGVSGLDPQPAVFAAGSGTLGPQAGSLPGGWPWLDWCQQRLAGNSYCEHGVFMPRGMRVSWTCVPTSCRGFCR